MQAQSLQFIDLEVQDDSIHVLSCLILLQPGKEYSVLYQLISKHDFLSNGLHSAFLILQNPATVYLEASFSRDNGGSSLIHTLDILSRIQICTLATVPFDDITACPDVPKATGPMRSPGERVKIKQRGLYQGDVRVVVDSLSKLGWYER